MLIVDSAKEQPPIREFSIEKTCFLPSFLFTVSIVIFKYPCVIRVHGITRSPHKVNALRSKAIRFSSLFSLLSSPEKAAAENGEKSEKRKEKSEKYQKKKPLTRLFLLGGTEGARILALDALGQGAGKQSPGLFSDTRPFSPL